MSANKKLKDRKQSKALKKTEYGIDNKPISIKWLIAILCIGFTSAGLMGIALFATTDGRVQLTKLPQAANNFSKMFILGRSGLQSDRLNLTIPRQRFENKRQISFSTEQRLNGRTVIKPQKFNMIHLSLVESRNGRFKYPPFNALSLFATVSKSSVQNINQIYNGHGSSEITFNKVEFNTDDLHFNDEAKITDNEAKIHIRKSFGRFVNGRTNSENLLYNLIRNSQNSFSETANTDNPQENISYIRKQAGDNNLYNYSEDLISFASGQTITNALRIVHYNDNFSMEAAKVLTKYIDPALLNKGGIIRLGLETDEDGNETVVRASFYQKSKHIVTVAMDDDDEFVKAAEPETNQFIIKALNGKLTSINTLPKRNLPLYDSIYRATLSYDLPDNIIKLLMRIIATDVDLKSITSDTDTIDIFYPESKAGQDQNVNILYIKSNIGDKVHRYYRYKSLDGKVDYYNYNGTSPKQFLLRNPVPNGHFSSPFGSRRHPILGYVRMHTGVDWAAPLHSIIVAAGDGVVTRMGPTPGYGNHTEITHANGYMTSYSHQSGFAAGIKPGVHVHQGQVIGYIGSTGLSTGAHCHFEIVVNGIKVNPMRVKLPNSKALTGRDIILFKQRRDNIDAILEKNKL